MERPLRFLPFTPVNTWWNPIPLPSGAGSDVLPSVTFFLTPLSSACFPLPGLLEHAGLLTTVSPALLPSNAWWVTFCLQTLLFHQGEGGFFLSTDAWYAVGVRPVLGEGMNPKPYKKKKKKPISYPSLFSSYSPHMASSCALKTPRSISLSNFSLHCFFCPKNAYCVSDTVPSRDKAHLPFTLNAQSGGEASKWTYNW